MTNLFCLQRDKNKNKKNNGSFVKVYENMNS